MNEIEQERSTLQFLADAGQCLLMSGAEIWRTQQTLQIMARSLERSQWSVYVIANGVFLSTSDGMSEVRHVPQTVPHFGKVAAVNALSRDLAQGRETLETARVRIAQIAQMPSYRMPVAVLATGVGAGGFCYMFGSSPTDAVCAFVIGLLLALFQCVFVKYPANKLVYNLSSACVVGLLGVGVVQMGIGSNLNQILIGGIFPLVPGLLITTAIRDMTNSDYISGVIHMVDAFLVAGSIALGIGFALGLSGLLLGGAL